MRNSAGPVPAEGDETDGGEEMNQTAGVLAMYDVRGIQNYIYKTGKIKDAIGASAIVENIIDDALNFAVGGLIEKHVLTLTDVSLDWDTDEGPTAFEGIGAKKIQVLFVGGGNAYVTFESRALCIEVNRIMSKYVIENTYSLQLAIAIVDISGEDGYARDYDMLQKEMSRVKAEMTLSRPLGALPVMETEPMTGYPALAHPRSQEDEPVGTESDLKKQKETGYEMEQLDKILDMYVTKKGTDSTIAVVHIDGNNMGLRIRDLMQGIESYSKAVPAMRKISYQIKHSYSNVFTSMKALFEAKARTQVREKEDDYFVRTVLTAGDDITYVCNGRIAMATVEYFCREIVKYTMTGETDPESLLKYGFTLCAGIAYINSHFPFSTGYEVAEACCESAKSRAKREQFQRESNAGNWVDFHFCQNIQARDLQATRKREYVTREGICLLKRPYFVSAGSENGWPITEEHQLSLNSLKRGIMYFQNEDNLPRSFAKQLRNLYPQGEAETEEFESFLESRGWKMPDRSENLYEIQIESQGQIRFEECNETAAGRKSTNSEGTDTMKNKKNVTKVAKWYDALELIDCYIDLGRMERENEEISSEN